MSAASPLARLHRALVAGNLEAGAAGLEEARLAGALVSDAHGFLVPHEAEPPMARWSFGGSLPEGRLKAFHVKPLPLPADRRAVLDCIFGVLRQEAPQVPPQWLLRDSVVSYYLDDAVDLAALIAEGGHEAATFVDACLASFTGLADWDDRLRSALRAQGLSPRRFPLEARYQRACAGLARIFDPATAQAVSRSGPADATDQALLLFSDPKPANLLITKPVRRAEAGAPLTPYRIDLDMMHYETTVELLAALTCFSHPMCGAVLDGGRTAFETQLSRIRGCVQDRGPSHEGALQRTVWYHLLRNFVSAVETGRADKVATMARLLACACKVLDDIEGRGRVAQGLTRLLDQAGNAHVDA